MLFVIPKCGSESSVPSICCHGWTSQPTPLVQWIIIIPALWRFFSWIIALSLLHHSSPVFLRSFLAAVLSDVFKKITTPSSYQPFALLPFVATFLKICLYSLSIPHFPFLGRNWLCFNPFSISIRSRSPHRNLTHVRICWLFFKPHLLKPLGSIRHSWWFSSSPNASFSWPPEYYIL